MSESVMLMSIQGWELSPERLARDKSSSLLDPFISYEEKREL
jgi:hypothetical protein